jgi:hypothetical protein
MRNMLSVNLYLHRKRVDEKGQVPIVIRIKLQGQKRDISSGLRIKPDQWNSKFSAAKGSNEAAKQTNQLLSISKSRLFQIFSQLSYAGEVSIDDVVQQFQGKTQGKKHSLVQLVEEHNNRVKN